MENETHYAEAVIDNGSFGTRTIRFETGRLARRPPAPPWPTWTTTPWCCRPPPPASTPRTSSTSSPSRSTSRSGCTPRARSPARFFRREGRPCEDAILTCRLIDRPLRPTFKKGLRNEVQVVITVMALNPDHPYDVLAINAASAVHAAVRPALLRPDRRRPRRPDRGPVGRLPDAHRARGRRLRHGRRRPRPGGRRRRDHDGRGRGHRADLPAGPGRRPGADRGGRRRRPRRREALHQAAVRGPGRAGRAGRQAVRRVPGLPRLRGRRPTTPSRPPSGPTSPPR